MPFSNEKVVESSSNAAVFMDAAFRDAWVPAAYCEPAPSNASRRPGFGRRGSFTGQVSCLCIPKSFLTGSFGRSKKAAEVYRDLIEEISLGANLTIFRRRDGEIWRKPVDGRHLGRTTRIFSEKNHRNVMCESEGEDGLFCYLEIHPWFLRYREQFDLVRLTDRDGTHWAVPDALVELRGHGPAWVEGKYLLTLSEKERIRLLRFQRAFADAGYFYRLIDQGWTRSRVVSRNIFYAFEHRDIPVSARDVEAAHSAVSNGTITLRELCSQLTNQSAAYAFALMARGHIEIPLHHPFSMSMPVTAVSVPDWT